MSHLPLVMQETSVATRTYELVTSIHATRMKWLVLILRMQDGRLVKTALQQMYNNRKVGDLLMDAPMTQQEWQELFTKASDKDE